LQIRCHQFARQLDGPRFVRIADDDAAQDERPTGADGQTFALFAQQASHAAAHRAATNQSDAEGFVHVR
jgi:hypothetical protein